MPKMSGIAMADALAATHPQIPVILMSGNETGEAQSLSPNVVVPVITKPFDVGKLLNNIRSVLDLRQG
jgi:DNA-binding NtrC family response regulator